MVEVVVSRSGKPPLRLKGEPLTTQDSRFVRGKERNRWFSVQVFGLPNGDLVVAMKYKSLWESEAEFAYAKRASRDGLPGAFASFLAEFFARWNCWHRTNPSSARDWELLRCDLAQLLGEVCATCGVVEDLDAVGAITGSHSGG
jgi:hypothetical protein